MQRIHRLLRSTAVAAVTLLAVTACADLEVDNLNSPDRERAVSNPEDVEALIAGTYNQWFGSAYGTGGPSNLLSSQSFQHSSTPSNFSMLTYSAIPRGPVVNDPAGGDDYAYWSEAWNDSYGVLASVREGLLALDDEEIASGLSESRVQRARAFARYMQGMAHASIAVLYAQGFIVDETVDTSDPASVEVATSTELMDAAVGYFDQAISLADDADFDIPASWMIQTSMTAEEFIQVMHSDRARLRAAIARTADERANLDWGAIIDDIEAGVPDGWLASFDWDLGWFAGAFRYTNWNSWSQMNYFVMGMADQSGLYQEWLSYPLEDRHPQMGEDETPFLIDTPDERFPQGSTIEEQQNNPGTVYLIPCQTDDDDVVPGEPCFGDFAISGNWSRPARGTWRWSYYFAHEYGDYAFRATENAKEMYYIDPEEMQLLRAEGLYHLGDEAAAAAIVDETRTAAGLDPIADGDNGSCVPMLPDESCGDLFEALKWEKRMEARMTGPYLASWYFDGRGWGDLYQGTQLEFPLPCEEADILGLLPCDAYGGDGESSAPVSTYGWETM